MKCTSNVRDGAHDLIFNLNNQNNRLYCNEFRARLHHPIVAHRDPESLDILKAKVLTDYGVSQSAVNIACLVTLFSDESFSCGLIKPARLITTRN